MIYQIEGFSIVHCKDPHGVPSEIYQCVCSRRPWNTSKSHTIGWEPVKNTWKTCKFSCEKTYEQGTFHRVKTCEKESCSGAFSQVFSQGLKSQILWRGHFSCSYNLWNIILFWSFFTVRTAAGHTQGQNLKTDEQDTFHMVPWTDYIVFINILAKFDRQYDMSLMSNIPSSENWDMHS